MISNHQYDGDEVLTIKAIRGGKYNNYEIFGGAGISLLDEVNITGVPILVAGGGSWGNAGGGGYNGGNFGNSSGTWGATSGYSWDETVGTSTTYCNSASCNIGATGGTWSSDGGYGGTGYCGSGYTCTQIAGGNAANSPAGYPASTYGNWETNTLTGGKGYASIRWCGPSGSASTCPDTCLSDINCDSISICRSGFCEYDNKKIITACNANDAYACQVAFDLKLNRTCEELKTTMTGYNEIPENGSFILTYAGGNSPSEYNCDMTQSPAWTGLYFSVSSGASYTVSHAGYYCVSARGGVGGHGYWSGNGVDSGGKVSFCKNLNEGQLITATELAGSTGNYYPNGGGYGGGGPAAVVYIDSVLHTVAGGSGGGSGVAPCGATNSQWCKRGGGGAGWKAGKGTNRGSAMVSDSYEDGSYGGNSGSGAKGEKGYPYGGDGGVVPGGSRVGTGGGGGGAGYCDSTLTCTESVGYGMPYPARVSSGSKEGMMSSVIGVYILNYPDNY